MSQFNIGQFVKVKNPSWFKATTKSYVDLGMDINGPLKITKLWGDNGVYVGADPIPWLFQDLDFVEIPENLEGML